MNVTPGPRRPEGCKSKTPLDVSLLLLPETLGFASCVGVRRRPGDFREDEFLTPKPSFPVNVMSYNPDEFVRSYPLQTWTRPVLLIVKLPRCK